MYVKIHDIVPYERNARHNASAVPVVADSIKEFGLRGTIGLESRERPVIVWGHTRVEACRSLGWDEIPDSKIEYCDDLTDEQIKAFRIADNKTGEVATWNKSMLREEVRSLKDFDMSRFGLDFKSKRLDYGHERLRTDDAYNLRLVSRSDCGRDGMPRMKRCMAKPADMIGFNYAKSTPEDDKAGRCCHFFIDDYQFERVWARPAAYLECLRGFDCVLTPDFSLYLDMPDAMQRWNRYRSQALGHWWQEQGGGNESPGARARAALRRRHWIRFRRLRGRRVQGRRFPWEVGAHTLTPASVQPRTDRHCQPTRSHP